MKLLHKNLLVITLLAGIGLQSCVRNPVTGKKEVVFMSEEQEKALGVQSHPSVVATMGLYDNAKLQAFITEKGKAMGAISHRPQLEYNFNIVDSPVVNAFAVPGGYVYFTRGIMAHFNNEAEFAGVLGHEIGHITARHSAAQQRNEILGQIGLMAGIIFSETFRGMASEAAQSLQVLMLKYSREHESQSDELGVSYSSKVGYDAIKMSKFFGTLKRLSAKSGQTIPEFMSTHPDPGQREVKVEAMAKEYQSANPATYTVNRDSYLRMIDGIIYGNDPKQGFVENGFFYHPELKFQFPVPKDWQTENSPIQFQMAPKDGKSMMMFTVAQGKTLDEAAQNTVKQYSLQVSESNKTTINGIPAFVMVSQQQAQQQQGQQTQAQDPAKVVKIATWLLDYNGMILAFHGMALASDFNTNLSTFQQVALNFRTLTDPEKLNRKPERIAVKIVSQNTTFQAAMKGFGMADSRLEELAILNQLQLSDPVTKGTLLKAISR
jgi:predicted Zn-dependent protease